MIKSSALVNIAFILVSLDSFLVYFGKNITGTILPVNIITLLLLLLIMATKGVKYLTPNNHVLAGLSLCVLGFISGAVILPEFGILRLLEIISALTAFIIGYAFIKYSTDCDSVASIFLGIGLIYTVTCVIALSMVLPSVFPVIEKLWSLNGTLISRPEITTDQNFQIFYLIPGLIVLSLPYKKTRLTLTILIVLGSLYTLAKLQTRSGVLVCLSVIAMCVLAPIWTTSLGRRKTFLLPLAGIIITAVFLPLILEYANAIILRFTETDFSTGLGRLHSFLYLFQNIYKPTWWLAHGNAEIIALTGNKPHSNSTAVFLDGGLLSLIGWTWLFVMPLYRLSRMFFKRRLDNLTTMILIGGIASFVTQLSLNVPLMDQVWLWAGAVLGAEARMRQISNSNSYNHVNRNKNDPHDKTKSSSTANAYQVLRLKKKS